MKIQNKKCNICKEREGNKKGMCSICYSREYRKNNKEKIKPVSQRRYLRHREKNIKRTKEWHKNNRDIINAKMRVYNKENKELRDLREKTRYNFNHLKENGKCKDCGGNVKLEFHHPKPYKYDYFDILCRECHLDRHGKLLVRTNKKECVLMEKKEK